MDCWNCGAPRFNDSQIRLKFAFKTWRFVGYFVGFVDARPRLLLSLLHVSGAFVPIWQFWQCEANLFHEAAVLYGPDTGSMCNSKHIN